MTLTNNNRPPLSPLASNGLNSTNYNNKHDHSLSSTNRDNKIITPQTAVPDHSHPSSFSSSTFAPRKSVRVSFSDEIGNPNTPRTSWAFATPTQKQYSGYQEREFNMAEPYVEVGDTVSVPGGMTGVVKYIGTVQGKAGKFAGVELHQEFASRGKNDGDVDGIRYFTTSVSGAGIFLPARRATKQESPTLTNSTFPPTPTTPSFQPSESTMRKATNSKARTPPTASIPRFSQSVGPGARHPFSQTVGPGARAPSPQLKQTAKLRGRPSLPRPESPTRNPPTLQATPARASGRTPRLGISPAPNQFSKTVKPTTPAAPSASRSLPHQDQSNMSPDAADDTPTALRRPSLGPRSAKTTRSFADGNEEATRLNQKLEDRDKQLKEQAASLAEMEASLAELQSLVASNAAEQKAVQSPVPEDPSSDSSDVAQLRALLREKNEKIQMLTAEFDSHRADFRSTIDTLEMASTETERVYEKRVQELLQEVEELQNGREDVATVASQLKQLEELVQELEEGLEDARRGEAEAKGEVEFLRGEIERARLELRREREKAAKALKGAGAAVKDGSTLSNGSRDLEQRDDEIRGLKAIIHSLSSGAEMGSPAPEARANGPVRNGVASPSQTDKATNEELAQLKETVSSLQHEKSELQGLIDRKNFREDELERENAHLRSSGDRNARSSLHTRTDSSSTATMHTANRMSNTSTTTAARTGSISFSNSMARTAQNQQSASNSRPTSSKPIVGAKTVEEIAATAQDANDEDNDTASQTASTTDDTASVSAADTDTMWCELCETTGHDILTCSRMFGEAPKENRNLKEGQNGEQKEDQSNGEDLDRTITTSSATPTNKSNLGVDGTQDTEDTTSPGYETEDHKFFDAEEGKNKENHKATDTQQSSDTIPDGAAPGKSSGVVDMSKWCAMCEKDGHESVDCPFEEDYY